MQCTVVQQCSGRVSLFLCGAFAESIKLILRTISISVIDITAGADDGIEEIRAAGIVLTCFQTVTGIKFVITAEPTVTADLREVLKEIYVLYTECVLKDPFYELEMPIRSDLFVQAVDAVIQQRVSKTPLSNNLKQHR